MLYSLNILKGMRPLALEILYISSLNIFESKIIFIKGVELKCENTHGSEQMQ